MFLQLTYGSIYFNFPLNLLSMLLFYLSPFNVIYTLICVVVDIIRFPNWRVDEKLPCTIQFNIIDINEYINKIILI